MELYNLVVEVTRRCNMLCGHCLRGKRQNKSMSRVHLHNFLRNLNYISSVTFTGGEPTLPSGITAVYDFMEICNILGVDVGSFYMVTNAKVRRPEIPIMVKDLYNFCSDNEVSSIDISTDQFHERNRLRISIFRSELEEELEYTHGLTELVSERPNHIDYDNIIHEGRGAQYGSFKYFELPDIHLERWDDNDELRVTEGDIYLNCNGNVINGCDWSYESQEEPEKIICTAEDNLEEALLNYHAASYETA
jgi:hypothetical protein